MGDDVVGDANSCNIILNVNKKNVHTRGSASTEIYKSIFTRRAVKQIKTTYIKEVLSPVGVVNPRQRLSALKETMKASNTVLNMCVQVQHLLSSAVRSVHVPSLNLLYHAAVISGMVCACLVIKSSRSHSLHRYVLAHSSRTLIAEMFDLFFFSCSSLLKQRRSHWL